jgi:hypothetical protein
MKFWKFVRPIALASTILLPAAGAMAATKPAPSITGIWSGKAAQVGRSGGYAVKLTFTAKTITSDYADLGCAGTLAKAGANGNYSFYVEKITTGGIDATTNKGCVDGSVTLIKSGDSLIWGWLGAVNGKPIVVYATLTQEPGAAPSRGAEHGDDADGLGDPRLGARLWPAVGRGSLGNRPCRRGFRDLALGRG